MFSGFSKFAFVGLCVIMLAALVSPVHAVEGGAEKKKAEALEYLKIGAESSGLKLKDKSAPPPQIYAANLIRYLLGAYGIIFVVLMVHAGHILITAHGMEDRIKSAHKIIFGAVIGLVVIITAYSISYYVAQNAVEVLRHGTPY